MSQKYQPTVCVIGGGAAGFFGAITCAERGVNAKIIILEQSKAVLNKVKISGGGRCNVTHACFDPQTLIDFYPRGNKELLGPFYTFNPTHTFEWFENRGVELKTEADNRVFPVTNRSETIINCLVDSAKANEVEIWNHTKIMSIVQEDSGKWLLETSKGQAIHADVVLMASGGSPLIWNMLEGMHEIIEPVSSLFTFNIQHYILEGLPGVSVPHAEVTLSGHQLQTDGPLLITHWGLSGPAILKMSAWGARLLHAMNYRVEISINWTGLKRGQVEQELRAYIREHPKKKILHSPMFKIPSRLWRKLMQYIKFQEKNVWLDLDEQELRQIINIVTQCRFKVNGKSTFKEEFVTAGGVALHEVDFRTMESKKLKNLFFAGEVLDIDALTGGFNFQAAWTTAYIAGESIADVIEAL